MLQQCLKWKSAFLFRFNFSVVFLTALTVNGVYAETFPLPQPGEDLIGQIRHTKAHQEDTLIDIARRFSVGQDEMMMANSNVDRWLPREGTDVLIPQEYILPDAPHSGVVVNIPEMRLYYFPVKVAPPSVKKPVAKPMAQKSATKTSVGKVQPNGAGAKAKGKTVSVVPAKHVVAPPPPPPPVVQAPDTVVSSAEVITYPVSMGRMDWKTPIGKTSVVRKQKDPSWTPPASIKREHAAKGDPLPDVVPPGPNNPLGKYAMSLGVSGYLIHGTDAPKSDGIGMRVTHGCMRMYNEDIEKLFPLIPVGAPVYLVNQSVKFGWRGGVLYMEVSQPLDEDVGIPPHDVDLDLTKEQQAREDAKRTSYLTRLAMAGLEKQRASRGEVEVRMEKVRLALERPTGIPVAIGGQGTGWESAVAGSTGIAPPPKPKLTDESALSPAPAPRSRTRSESPEGAPLDDQGTSSYGGVSEEPPQQRPSTQGRVTTMPYGQESSGTPSGPSTYGSYSYPPSGARKSSVKTAPYGAESNSETDPEEE